jgi:pyruvate/2-oxoglutarate dehydrogenase complex dihydrolipoamide acyltransferase (E2) component
MIYKVKIPRISTNVEEATLTQWIRHEGDAVRKGDPIAELTTDKAAFELESPASGKLRKTLARERSILPTGYVIALIGSDHDPLPDLSEHNRRLLEARRPAAAKAISPSPAKTADDAPIRATPSARRVAREHQLDLSEIRKKVATDVITEDHVRKFLSEKTP